MHLQLSVRTVPICVFHVPHHPWCLESVESDASASFVYRIIVTMLPIDYGQGVFTEVLQEAPTGVLTSVVLPHIVRYDDSEGP